MEIVGPLVLGYLLAQMIMNQLSPSYERHVQLERIKREKFMRKSRA